MSREDFNWWRRVVTGVLVGILLMAVSGVWGMYAQIQRMEADNRVWQERVSSQLDSITQRLDNAYTEGEAAQDQRDVGRRLSAHAERLDEHGNRLDEHESRIRELEQ